MDQSIGSGTAALPHVAHTEHRSEHETMAVSNRGKVCRRGRKYSTVTTHSIVGRCGGEENSDNTASSAITGSDSLETICSEKRVLPK